MLRKTSPARRQATRTGLTLSASAPARRLGGAMAAVASVMAFAATSGVAAESLAQPRDAALEQAAAGYIRFREDVAAIEATPFKNAEIMREAHRRLSAHNSKELSAGWVAYAALVAADTPAFRAALEQEVNANKKRKDKLKGADAFIADLSEDPSYARRLDGANEAIERVLAMTSQDSARFSALGEKFKEQAYALQKTKWGVAKMAASSVRIDEAENFARSRPAATAPTLASVTDKGVTAPGLSGAGDSWTPDWGASGASGRMTEPNAQVIMNRVLNLAARYSLSGVNAKMVAAYARNDKSEQCLSFAQMTLKQCIAATRAPFEEAFCIGEHALHDVSSCIGWVAGVEKQR